MNIEVVMNKKGYTLVEIIVVIAIVATIGTVGAVGLSRVISNSKQSRYEDLIRDLKAAGNTYFTIYSEYPEYDHLKNDFYVSGNLPIPIQTLKDALLVDQNQKNPKDNTDLYGRVVLIRDGEVPSESFMNYRVVLCNFTSQQLEGKDSDAIKQMELTCNY